MRGIRTPSRRRTLQVVGNPFLILIACSQELSGFFYDIHRITERDSELSSDDAVIQVRSRTMLGGQEYHVVIVTSGLYIYVVGHVQLHTAVNLL